MSLITLWTFLKPARSCHRACSLWPVVSGLCDLDIAFPPLLPHGSTHHRTRDPGFLVAALVGKHWEVWRKFSNLWKMGDGPQRIYLPFFPQQNFWGEVVSQGLSGNHARQQAVFSCEAMIWCCLISADAFSFLSYSYCPRITLSHKALACQSCHEPFFPPLRNSREENWCRSGSRKQTLRTGFWVWIACCLKAIGTPLLPAHGQLITLACSGIPN